MPPLNILLRHMQNIAWTFWKCRFTCPSFVTSHSQYVMKQARNTTFAAGCRLLSSLQLLASYHGGPAWLYEQLLQQHILANCTHVSPPLRTACENCSSIFQATCFVKMSADTVKSLVGFYVPIASLRNLLLNLVWERRGGPFFTSLSLGLPQVSCQLLGTHLHCPDGGSSSDIARWVCPICGGRPSLLSSCMGFSDYVPELTA